MSLFTEIEMDEVGRVRWESVVVDEVIAGRIDRLETENCVLCLLDGVHKERNI